MCSLRSPLVGSLDPGHGLYACVCVRCWGSDLGILDTQVAAQQSATTVHDEDTMVLHGMLAVRSSGPSLVCL